MFPAPTRTLPCGPCWDPPLPTWGRRRLKKLRVVSKDRLRLIVHSSKLVTLVTHFVRGRTVFCTNDPRTCPFDHAEVGVQRYAAWLTVCLKAGEDPALLRLTEDAVRSEPRLLCSDVDLRGLELEVWRMKGHERSAMRAYLIEGEQRAEGLRPEIDLRDYLVAMHESEDRPAHRRTRPVDFVGCAAAANKGQVLFVD